MIAYFEIVHTERRWYFWKRKVLVTYPMTHIYMTEMDKLLESSPLIALPMHFDSLRRVWPEPPKDIKVVFAQ